MTDKEIKATVKKILEKLQDPKTGWNSRREELRRKYRGNEYTRAKQELLFKVDSDRRYRSRTILGSGISEYSS